MKTILRIVIILLLAALVAGAFNLAVSNTASGSNGTGGQFQAQGTDSGQRPSRPDGGGEGREGREGGASLGAGLLGLLVSLAKLAGIGAIVLFLQKGLRLMTNSKTGTISAA